MGEQNNILQCALDYHRLGWCIIPIGSDKKPLVQWKKYERQRPTEAQLKRWFGSGRVKSLAAVCGAVSGKLAVLDLDSKERCDWWRKTHPELAAQLPTVQTKRGLHVYFRAEPFRKRNAGYVDLLCEGACVILPPSPEKKWLKPVNGELPLLDPFSWDLEQFGIKRPERTDNFAEDREDSEDVEDAERHRSHSGGRVVLSCLDEQNRSEVERAIDGTKPTAEGQRNTAIFPFCQWLKAIPELRDCQPGQLKPIVIEWHRRAYEVIGTKPFTNTWADFVHGWKRVKWPKGDVMLTYAVKRVLDGKTVLPESAEYDTYEAKFLLKVCFELQQGVGNKPFFLASRKAGGIIGTSEKTAYKLLEMFVADGFLRVVQEHTQYRAPRYRYIGR